MSAIIEKVRKLRALSQSTNLHEAEAAARAAERIIQEHALSETDIDVASEDEKPVAAAGPIATWNTRIPRWQNYIAGKLARQYQCAAYTFHRPDRTCGVRACGRVADIETLRYQFAFFSAEIVRLSSASGRGRGLKWRTSFCWGAAEAVLRSLATATNEVRATAAPAALARVDARGDAARAFRKGLHPGLSDGDGKTVSVRLDGDGFARGTEAGANISQRSALGIGGGRLLRS